MNKESIRVAAQAIIDKANRADQKQRAAAMSDICETLIDAKSELTVANVVRHMKNNGYKLSKTTVYNESPNNLYDQLFKLWSKHKLLQKPNINSKTEKEADIDSIFGIDIKKINDQVTRYQVSLMLGQLKSYKQQLDLLSKVEPLLAEKKSAQNRIASKESSPDSSDKPKLSDYEVDVIKEVIGSPLFEFDEDGKMISATSIKRGTSLSPEGFKQALGKVIDGLA